MLRQKQQAKLEKKNAAMREKALLHLKANSGRCLVTNCTAPSDLHRWIASEDQIEQAITAETMRYTHHSLNIHSRFPPPPHFLGDILPFEVSNPTLTLIRASLGHITLPLCGVQSTLDTSRGCNMQSLKWPPLYRCPSALDQNEGVYDHAFVAILGNDSTLMLSFNYELLEDLGL